jgi:hypothetical protein
MRGAVFTSHRCRHIVVVLQGALSAFARWIWLLGSLLPLLETGYRQERVWGLFLRIASGLTQRRRVFPLPEFARSSLSFLDDAPDVGHGLAATLAS